MSSNDNTSAGRLTSRLYRHRVVLALLLAAMVATLAFLGRNVGTDNSLEIWFLENDPTLVAYRDFKKEFGNDEAIIVAATDPKNTFAPAALERIRTASQKLAAHPKVKRVISIASGRHVDGDAIEIRTEPLLDPGPVTEESARNVQQRLDANPTLRGALVGKDPRMSLIVVQLRNIENLDHERGPILGDIRKIATDELARDGGGFHLGGIGVIYEGMNEATLRDQAIFVALLSLIIAVGLWVLFRRWIWVVAGLALMTAGLVFARGLAGIVGRDMNAVTGMVPTLVMTVGLMDLVHIVATFDEEFAAHPTLSRKEIMLRSVGLVAVPCIWNTFSDAAGFLSLSTSHLQVIRDLGWSAAVGLILLLFTTFALSIPLLARFGGGRNSAVLGEKARREDPVARATGALARFAQQRRVPILIGAVVLTAISVLGIVGNSKLGLSGLVVDTYTLGFLPEDHPVRVDHDAIEKGFGRYVPLEFEAVTTDSGIKKPETLRALEKAERTMEDHPKIGRVTGLPEIVSRLHQVVKDGEPAELRIPDTREAVAQELLLYESDPESELDSLVDPGFTHTRVTARGPMDSARELSKTLHELEQKGNEALGSAGKIHASGYIPLYVRIVDHVTQTQVDSFASALLLVTVVLVILLRSFKLGLAALVPNIVPVVMVLGFMGFVGIRLDIATVLIAAIAIGISVNDTTHVMFRFKHELRENPGDPGGAIERMMRSTGRAVVASSGLLLAGFSVLLFASVSPVRHFGLLIGLTLILALMCDLLITPALLSVLHRRRRDDMKQSH